MSLHGAVRLLRRLSIELALLAAGAWLGSVPLLLFWAAALSGAVALWRRGELHLALFCPRLDALGLRPGSRAAPWAALSAADQALRVLTSDIGHFREFFPEARRDLCNAATRAVEAHRSLLRSEAALAVAPSGEARALLEAQRQRALAEIEGLTHALRELRARLVASTQPLPCTADPAPALRALDERSQVLSAELSRGGA